MRRAHPSAALAARAALRRPEPAARCEQIARLFKERRFAAGETVVKEGAGGAAFFVIESGEATVTVGGEERADAHGRATTSARSR